MDRIKQDKKHYTKNDIVKDLIYLGMDVVNSKYVKLDPSLDELMSKMQNMVIEMNGQKVVIKKSKDQVYQMLVEKGLQHIND
jgi:hypothetical protein